MKQLILSLINDKWFEQENKMEKKAAAVGLLNMYYVTIGKSCFLVKFGNFSVMVRLC